MRLLTAFSFRSVRYLYLLLFPLFVCPLLMGWSAHAITINIEYSSGTLFYPGIDSTAKAAIDAAAADVSAAITTSLSPVYSDVVTGRHSGTVGVMNASFYYTNPTTGANESISAASVGPEQVKLFVGTRLLDGATLGLGGWGGVVADASEGTGDPFWWEETVDNAETQMSARYSRGGGPRIGTSTGLAYHGFYHTPYEIDFGISVGSFSLDIDSDNDDSADNGTELDAYWHWDHNTAVGANKNDLYTIALHEILHAIGLGTSASWMDLKNGTTWNGSEVQALANSNGGNLVSGTGGHIQDGLMSTRLSDGSPQEVALDPTNTRGTRKELTALDLAFLRDIGYETITPGIDLADFNGDGSVDAADLDVWQTAYGNNSNTEGDGDRDGDTDGFDFLVWQQRYTGSPKVLTSIPEPSSLCLFLLGLGFVSTRRR